MSPCNLHRIADEQPIEFSITTQTKQIFLHSSLFILTSKQQMAEFLKTPPLHLVSSGLGVIQCVRDFLPLSILRRITSIPPCVLILLIQPWVLFRLMLFGWYSVPLFPVRTCWYCQGGDWKTSFPFVLVIRVLCSPPIHDETKELIFRSFPQLNAGPLPLKIAKNYY